LSDANDAFQQEHANAATSGQNAEIERQNARRVRFDAAAEEERQRRETRKDLGRSAATISQAGIGPPGTGSAGMALAQSAAEAELSALNIRYGGETEGQAYEARAGQHETDRRAALRRARAAKRSGIIGAASEALQGYSNYRGASARKADRAKKRAPAPKRGVPQPFSVSRTVPY
jgi:hypothetical protein